MLAVQRKYVYNTVSVGMYKFSKQKKKIQFPLLEANVTRCKHRFTILYKNNRLFGQIHNNSSKNSQIISRELKRAMCQIHHYTLNWKPEQSHNYLTLDSTPRRLPGYINGFTTTTYSCSHRRNFFNNEKN